MRWIYWRKLWYYAVPVITTLLAFGLGREVGRYQALEQVNETVPCDPIKR